MFVDYLKLIFVDLDNRFLTKYLSRNKDFKPRTLPITPANISFSHSMAQDSVSPHLESEGNKLKFTLKKKETNGEHFSTDHDEDQGQDP